MKLRDNDYYLDWLVDVRSTLSSRDAILNVSFILFWIYFISSSLFFENYFLLLIMCISARDYIGVFVRIEIIL